jgi:hypothetical protein
MDNPETVILNGQMYVLARENGALQYAEGRAVSLQEGEPGPQVSAIYDKGSPAGIGEPRRITRNSLGYYTGQNMDATTYGVWRIRQKLRTSATPANALTDNPVFWFEQGGYVYAVNGRYVYKLSTSGTAITLHREIDMGANAVGGRPAKFGNGGYAARWFVPAGASVKFWRQTTVGTEVSQAFSPVVTLNEALDAAETDISYTSTGDPVVAGDVIIIESERILITAVDTATNTLTGKRGYAGTTAASHADTTAVTQANPDVWAQDATYFSLAFCTSSVGAVAQLNRAYSTNLVDLSTDGGVSFPGTVAAGAYEVGTSATAITDIQTAATGLFVSKTDNLYQLVDGVSSQLTRFQEGDVVTGASLMVPYAANACYYIKGGVATFWNGERPIDVSPDASMLSDEYGPQVAVFRGTNYEIAYASESWLYQIYRDSAGTSSFILPRQKSGGSLATHTNVGDSLKFRGVFVDSSKRLWWAEVDTAAASPPNSNTFNHMALGAGGQPHAGASNHGEDSLLGRIQLPADDFGYPNTLKQLRSMEMRAKDVAATRTFTLNAYLDSASSPTTPTGSTVSSDGLTRAYFATPATCYEAAPYIEFSLTTAASDPRFFTVIMRGVLRPDGARWATFTIDTAANYPNGAAQLLSPTAILANIRALERGAPVAFVDADETSKDVWVVTSDARPGKIVAGVQHWLIDVQAQVWITA